MPAFDFPVSDQQRLLVEVLKLPINTPFYFIDLSLLAIFSLSHLGHSANCWGIFDCSLEPVVVVVDFNVNVLIVLLIIDFSGEGDLNAIAIRD